MPKRGQTGPERRPWDSADPAGFGRLADQFLEWLATRNFSPGTMKIREVALQDLFRWCEARGITRPHQASRPVLERYQRHLFHYRRPGGTPLSFRTQSIRLLAVRAYFRWLARANLIPSNPAADLELPRMEKRLPRDVLTVTEAEEVLRQPDLRTPLGIRDRAILETLYATGIRRSELVGLSLYDLNPEAGLLRIRLGKGKKERMVPLGERALAWIGKYLDEARPEFLLSPDEGHLFLTADGQSMRAVTLGVVVRGYLRQSGVPKKGACHLFRHTMATLMLEGGADIRFIQQMLGHAQLTTTEIYTQVSIRKLREVHAATHPGARLKAGGTGKEGQT